MTVLVTGAHGFVGQHVVRALRERFPTTPVRGLDAARPSADPPDGVELLYGRIEEPEDVHEAMDGVGIVIHLAAKVQPSSRDSSDLWQVNVEGTRTIYSAAAAAGCKLFVHMSSAGVYGNPRRPDPFHEDDAACPETPYQRTKWEAEEALRQISSQDTTLNIFRPAGIYGPGSFLELPQYRSIRRRRWAVELSGGVVVHPTYVDDVVHAILAILARPAPHETAFNIGGERPLRLQELRALQADVLGVPRHRFVLPTRLASPLARLAKPVLALLGQTNPLLAAMSRGEVFSAAVDDRRFRQSYPEVPVVSLQAGLREHITWATAQHLL